MLDSYCNIVKIDKGAPHNGHNRVLRGGSWINHAQNLRSANRNRIEPDNRNHNTGFRLAGALLADLINGRGSLNQWCFLFLCYLYVNKGQTQDPQCISKHIVESLLPGRSLPNEIIHA